jgi:hypothetical protein
MLRCRYELGRAGLLAAAALSVLCLSGGARAAQPPARQDAAPRSKDEDTSLLVGGKSSPRSKVDAQLPALVREALDQWTEAADRLELRIAVGETPEHIVLGHADDKTLAAAAKWMDDTFTCLDALVPRAGGRTPKVTIAILVDQEYTRSPAWSELLAELQARQILIAEAADYLRREPEGLTVRQTPLFLQPTFDLTGEGEFQLGNEVAHKYAQCLLTIRTGQLPDAVLWGLGYVVEQDLFESSYHLRLREFVYSSSHHDWKGEARRQLEAHRKDKGFSLAALAVKDEIAGRPEADQIMVWAALSYLAHNQPDRLKSLLLELSTLHAEADPSGVAPLYRGEPASTLAVLGGVLDALERSELTGWLAGKKPSKPKGK